MGAQQAHSLKVVCPNAGGVSEKFYSNGSSTGLLVLDKDKDQSVFRACFFL